MCPADVRHTEKIKKNKEQGRRREIKKEERVTVHGDGVNRIGRMEGRRRRWKKKKGKWATQTASSYEPTHTRK